MGWVGKGMYDLDCLGEVFTAQSGEVFFEGIQALDDGSPILLTIANHAGDVLNGNLAYAMALEEGMDIRKVLFMTMWHRLRKVWRKKDGEWPV